MSKILDDTINALKSSSLSSYRIAQDTGISDQTIINYRNGTTIPRGNNLKILSKYLGIDSGESEMLKSQAVPEVGNPVGVTISSGKVIPFYDAEAAAGNEYGMSMEPARQVGMIEIGSVLRDSESAIRVYGNSMVPNYPAGCVIGLKLHTDSFIEPGRVYVVETRDNRYLKRLYYNKDHTCFHCLSDNQMKYDDGPRKGELYYQDFEIPIKEVIRIHRVVGVIKRNIL